jgi:diadenosine tetraphosphate (Ap4A) HIT family hydrolase
MSDLWEYFTVVVREEASKFTNIKPEDWKVLFSVGISKLEEKVGKAKTHRWLFNNREAPKLFCKLIAEGVANE